MMAWWLDHVINMMTKLKRKAEIDGAICQRATQRLEVSWVSAVMGNLMSITSRVMATANIASQNISSRAFVLVPSICSSISWPFQCPSEYHGG
jgi:hypothetical protein